jgi:hypothetical protein
MYVLWPVAWHESLRPAFYLYHDERKTPEVTFRRRQVRLIEKALRGNKRQLDRISLALRGAVILVTVEFALIALSLIAS